MRAKSTTRFLLVSILCLVSSLLVCILCVLLAVVISPCCRSTPHRAAGSGPTTHIPGSNIVYAGVRSSLYGIEPFPSETGWAGAITTMAGYFPGSEPAAIWIVGTVDADTTGVKLEFPSDGNTYSLVEFSEEDRHESALSYFDTQGINVFLQVEPGFAEVETLIDLVLDRYGQHPCVVGFGADVEWYQNASDEEDARGGVVDDATAEAWEERVQAHNSSYQLFLKHWDPLYMPPTYRGAIVFVDDSQDFDSMDSFLAEMKVWSDAFYPNTVMFQYGYPADRVWWSQMANPVKEIGEALALNAEQPVGLIWVDFTLREVLPIGP